MSLSKMWSVLFLSVTSLVVSESSGLSSPVRDSWESTCSIVDRDAGNLSIKRRLDLCANAVGIIYFGICDVNVATKVTPFKKHWDSTLWHCIDNLKKWWLEIKYKVIRWSWLPPYLGLSVCRHPIKGHGHHPRQMAKVFDELRSSCNVNGYNIVWVDCSSILWYEWLHGRVLKS